MSIREEARGDEGVVHDLTRIAFADKPYSSQTEHLIVDALRANGALEVSLVAVAAKRIVGHVAFSRGSIERGGKWYALGPISVLPEVQRQGIGSALVAEGLSIIREKGASGCVLVGNPDYYTRFGFRHDSGVILEDMPPEYSMVLRFRSSDDGGLVRFHPAFAHP